MKFCNMSLLCLGEVAKLFADSGFICIACLISPYKRDRAACRAMLPTGDFIEVGASPARDALFKLQSLASWVLL